jgi:hypothetical protein
LPLDPAGETVRPASRIDHHKVTPVATRENIAGFSQGGGECGSAIGAAPQFGDLLFHLICVQAGSLRFQHFGVAGCALGPGLALALDMRALDPFVPEFLFERAGDFLVFAVIVAVADRRHALEVDPRPHNVRVLATFLLVHHHDARLAGETQFVLKLLDGAFPLFVIHALVGTGVDGGVIERLGGTRAGRDGLHFEKRAPQILGGDAPELPDLGALVGVGSGQMNGEATPSGAGCAFNNHRGQAPS